MNISLIVPTRNRPEQLRKLITSAYETASDPDNVEFCFYIDNDDTVSEEVILSFNNKNIKYMIGERYILASLWNDAFELATSDIFWHGNDDIIFRTPGWDKAVLEAFETYDDKIVFVYPASGNPNQKSGTHGFLHRNWVNTVEYFMPPFFSSDGCDGWINEVALVLNRIVFLPNVLIEHMHYTVGKAAMDTTYAERIANGKLDNIGHLYEELRPERRDNIRKLKEFIATYNTNIAILCPTRNRPHNIRRMVTSAYKTATYPDKIEFCFYIDDDDVVSEKAIKELDNKNVKYVRGERILFSTTWNKALTLTSASICMMGGDDLVFRTKGWDKQVTDVFDGSNDKILFVFGNDGAWEDRLGTHGFVHRNWIDTIGYFTPPYFSAQYSDVWLDNTALALGRRVYLPDMFIEHMHHGLGKSEIDDTYKEKKERSLRDNTLQTFIDTEPKRVEDKNKLQEFINSQNGYDEKYYFKDGAEEYKNRLLRSEGIVPALCYAFGATAPQELIGASFEEQLTQVVVTRIPRSVLDVGAGLGTLSAAFLKMSVPCVGLDSNIRVKETYEKTISAWAGPGANFVLGGLDVIPDIRRLRADWGSRNYPSTYPFIKNGLFDTIIFSSSIEHISEQEFNRNWPKIKLILEENHGLLIIVNKLKWNSINIDGSGWDHIRFIDSAVYDFLSSEGNVVFRQGSHLVVSFPKE